MLCPLVEAATSALFVVVTLRIVGLHVAPALPVYLYLAAAGLALAMIDLDHMRLPDKIVPPSVSCSMDRDQPDGRRDACTSASDSWSKSS